MKELLLLEKIDFLEKENEQLEQENKRLNTIINNIHNYIEKMSYCDIVDNPKKDLAKILKKGDDNV